MPMSMIQTIAKGSMRIASAWIPAFRPRSTTATSLTILSAYALWSLNEQINISIQARECSRQLERLRALDGVYPKIFSCRDHRMRRIFYRVEGDGYVLSNDPRASREWVGDICLMWWRPVVMTESGEPARCSM